MKKWSDCSFSIGDLKIARPVVQGGMGVGVSGAGLASAVANEGGIGVISAVGLGMATGAGSAWNTNIDALRQEIRKARSMTKGVLGVNIMVALTDFADLVKASIEEGIDVIFSGAGLPLNLPEFLTEQCKTKLVPIISSARAAGLITKKWKDKYNRLPDAFVLEGPLAGGHLGFKGDQLDTEEYSLETLLSQVLEETAKIKAETNVEIPVIAGGGVFYGSDIAKLLDMGAAAVQMGTRFVTTDECDASINFKNAYINCKKEDISIIESPVGLLGRAINNDFLRKVKAGEKVPKACPYHCIKTCKAENSPYCIALALISAFHGRMENGFAFIGARGYLADKIVSVKELFNSLEAEYSTSV